MSRILYTVIISAELNQLLMLSFRDQKIPDRAQ